MSSSSDTPLHQDSSDTAASPAGPCDGKVDGTLCDDADPCTAATTCLQGKCQGGVDACECRGPADCILPPGKLCDEQRLCDVTSLPYRCKAIPGTAKDCGGPINGGCAQPTCNADTGACVDKPMPPNVLCDDGNPCTQSECDGAGSCKVTVETCTCQTQADCEAKDDDNLCNGTLYCDKSSLPWSCKTNPSTVVQCSASVPGACTDNVCDAKIGKCVAQPKPVFAACDDGNPCTIGDACKGGACVSGQASCPCTSDKDCAVQEDGDACNGTLFCDLSSQSCKINPKTVVVCPDAGKGGCVQNVCEPSTGACKAVPVTDGLGCDDGLECTKNETCKEGACVASALGNTCDCQTDDDCKSKDDGNLCNGLLYCDASTGACKLNPATIVVCPTVADTECSKSLCEPTSGECAMASEATGTACNDGNSCTSGDGCDGSGACVGGTVTCACQTDADCAKQDDGDLCNGTMFCDKQSSAPQCKLNPATVVVCPTVDETTCLKNLCAKKEGTCKLTPVANGSPCSDGDACTVSTTCKDGACKGADKPCDDGDACTTDACDADLGCVHNDKNCDDANLCTEDVCDGGKCHHLGGTGPCDDGDPCSIGDKCQGQDCKAGVAKDCDDGDDCTADLCGKEGCSHTPVSTVCEDGNACTLGDVCIDGKCTGKATHGDRKNQELW
ncbi:MAG: hypothetical protein H6747_07930 [Deltaproteobacteria bacterium]|nr:hypothetical protein [Deltaproteobacteria bacterium]